MARKYAPETRKLLAAAFKAALKYLAKDHSSTSCSNGWSSALA